MLSSLRALGVARAIAWFVVGFVVAGGVAAWLLLLAMPVGSVPINVRWKADVTDARRVDLEREFHLTEGHPTEGTTGTTWAYRLTEPSTEGIRGIVQHPAVDDTAHINRVWFRPEFANDRTRRVIFYTGILASLGALATLCWAASRHRSRTSL